MPQSASRQVEIASFLVEPGDECVSEAVELEPAVNGFFHVHGFFHGQCRDRFRSFFWRIRVGVNSGAVPATSPFPLSPRLGKSGITEYSPPSRIRLTVGTSFSTGIDCRDRGCQSVFGGRTDFGKIFFRTIAPIL